MGFLDAGLERAIKTITPARFAVTFKSGFNATKGGPQLKGQLEGLSDGWIAEVVIDRRATYEPKAGEMWEVQSLNIIGASEAKMVFTLVVNPLRILKAAPVAKPRKPKVVAPKRRATIVSRPDVPVDDLRAAVASVDRIHRGSLGSALAEALAVA